VLSLIRKWLSPGNKPQALDLPGYGVVDCSRCHKYLRTGFALSLMSHLEREHKMHGDLAVSTAEHMLDLLLAYKAECRDRSKS
jgi:hypothetical protein